MTNKREGAACEKNTYGNAFGAGVHSIFENLTRPILWFILIEKWQKGGGWASLKYEDCPEYMTNLGLEEGRSRGL